MIRASLALALRELRRNGMRSGLTVLGVVIGVAAVITIVTLGAGARAKVTADVASLGRNLLVLMPPIPGIETQRTDISAIFIPDLIKVDLSTDRARFAGGGASHPTNPDDPGFSRLSIFGGDVLPSPLTGGNVAGGWPNGRRFGDDVVDIAVTALISDLRVNPPIIRGPAGDNVDQNDAVYNKVFPYAGTPMNGRNHPHH